MTRLRRIRLDGIGPTGARFDPVLIDLTDRTGEAARMALIHLENGGGKSVLLKLVFSAVLPGRRNTLGGVKLGDFVLSDDTGHVALEWAVDDGHGGVALLVTGTVLEWRNRTRSSDQSNLRQWWYAFRSVPGVMDLDVLPTRVDGRRPSRSAFRERLVDAWHAAPSLELADENGPERWREWLLANTPIDPELFSYQRAMNADESDAEELFASIRTGDDFVRMLLRAVVDPAEVRSFGDTLSAFSEHLSRRDDLERERNFTVEAIAALEPLADAQEAVERASEAVATARRDGWTLRARIAAEVDRSTGEAARLDAASQVDEAQASALDDHAGQLVAQGQELRRREAVFTVETASSRLTEAEGHAATSQRTANAWKLVDTVIDESTAAADRNRLQRELQRADAKDAPLREARDRAAAVLRARLGEEIDTITRAAEHEEKLAKQADGRRRAADEARRGAEGEAATLRANANANDGRAERVDQARAALVASATVEPGETAAAAAERWTITAVRAETDLEEREKRRAQIREREAQLRTDAERHADALVRLRPELTAATNEASRLEKLAAELADTDRLAEVLGAHSVDVLADASDILAALADAVGAAEGDLRELAVATNGDQKALDALGESGLLPPAPDVVAVWDVLTTARIPATTGWRWLAQRDDADERARLLALHPALAAGVVVTDPERADHARRVVADAGLDVRVVVAVGTAADFDGGGGHVWAAPVHRGLYDEAWAADERVRIEGRLTQASVTRRELELRAAGDRSLHQRLTHLVEQCPAGHLDALHAKIQALDEEVSGAEVRRGEIERERTALTREDEALAGGTERLRQVLAQATKHADACDKQAEDDTAAAGWRADAVRWRARADDLDADAEAFERDAERAVGDRDAARDRVGELQRIASAHGDERAELPRVDMHFAPDPATTTAVLRHVYRTAARRLETESAGKTVAADLAVAEAREADAAVRLSREPADVVAEARAVAADPAAGDTASRTEAQRRTAVEAGRLARLVIDISGDVAVATKELEARTPPRGRTRWTDLPADLEPRDAAHARELERQASEEQSRVAEQARRLHAKAKEGKVAADAARSRASVLAAHTQTLNVDDTPVDTTGVAPFDGSLEEAARLVADLAARYRKTAADHTAAVTALVAAFDAVRAVGTRAEYAGIGGVQTALAEEGQTTLAARARDLAARLGTICASIDADLAEVHKHRDGLIERLSTLVEQHLKLLKLAQRMSAIPGGLGEWKDKPFVTIVFQPPEPAALAARMGAVIDAAVHVEKRDPTVIILDAVRAAVVRRTAEGERAFAVTIIKPNAAMFDTTVDVGRLSTEFSGGQRLTAAILLYCTLASLRAYVRGQERIADAGVLFLDNPIGKANADYLLDLQFAVAERRGVQLVYTTGIADPEVHAGFEAIARLRNDADLRRHLNYIVVDDDIAERLAAGHSQGDPSGYVSATRLAAVPPP
jgi:hypothetical protein